MTHCTANCTDARYARFCEWHNRVWSLDYRDSNLRKKILVYSKDRKDRISRDMWNQLQTLICDDEQVVVSISQDWLRNLTFNVCRYFDEVYPGARPDPELIIWVHQEQLSWPLRGKDGRFVRNSGLLDDVWSVFSPSYTSEAMISRRSRFDLKPPFSKYTFEY